MRRGLAMGAIAGRSLSEARESRARRRSASSASLAVKTAQKVDGGAFSFLGIAFQATRDQVPVGIAAELGAGHDVVKAASHGRELTQTIKATATFPRVDGLAEGRRLEEIHILGIDGAGKAGRQMTAESTGSIGACSADLVWQEHLKHVSGFAALDQAQDTARNEATHGPARGISAEANAARKPGNGEAEPDLSLEAAVAEEMRIDGAVGDGQTQPGNEKVFDVLPDALGVGFFVFHGLSPEFAGAGARRSEI